MKHVKNFGIVALLALGVWALPGGGTAADFFGALLFVILTIGIGLLGGQMYRENRYAIRGLGDRWRGILYGAIGVMVLTLAAGSRLFESGPGTLLWLALLGGSGYAMYRVLRHAREY